MMIEKGVFQILAMVSLIIGVIEIYMAFWNIAFLIVSILLLIYGYAWDQVAKICDAVNHLEREVIRLKEELEL
jgi:NhaP-type Na+/H+ and K+/H+ antiporter